jgi:hypothetical protein
LSADSFDQLVGAQDQAGRNFELERLRRLEVDDHLQLGRLPGPSTAGYRIGSGSSGGISPILQASKRGADEEAMSGSAAPAVVRSVVHPIPQVPGLVFVVAAPQAVRPAPVTIAAPFRHNEIAEDAKPVAAVSEVGSARGPSGWW